MEDFTEINNIAAGNEAVKGVEADSGKAVAGEDRGTEGTDGNEEKYPDCGVKDIDEKGSLEEEIARLKEDGVRQKKEFEAAIKELEIRSAVLERLYGEGAKNPKLLLKLIDISKVGFDDGGGIVGIDEQIGSLKSSEGYLFEERGAVGSGGFRPGESGDFSETRTDFSQMTYSEMIRALGK